MLERPPILSLKKKVLERETSLSHFQVISKIDKIFLRNPPSGHTK